MGQAEGVQARLQHEQAQDAQAAAHQASVWVFMNSRKASATSPVTVLYGLLVLALNWLSNTVRANLLSMPYSAARW